MRRYIPINFTHVADTDGVGCAVLSKIAFNGDFVNGCTGYFVPPFIVPLGNNTENVANSFNMEKFKDYVNKDFEHMKHLIEEGILSLNYEVELPDENNYEEITFVIIVSDINISTDEISKLCERLSKEYPDCDIKTWYFDHHESNPYWKETSKESIEIVDYCYGTGYLDDFVRICTSSVNNGFSIDSENFTKRHIQHVDIKILHHDEAFYRYTILTEYGFFDHPEARRSATFIYFLYLYEAGLLTHLRRDQFISLVKFVYHVSNYDTFEFDRLDGFIPVKSDAPDALAVLYKSYHGDFFKFLNLMYTFICISSLNKEPLNDKYPDVPIPDQFVEKLDIFYTERQFQFNSDLNAVRIVPYAIVRRVLMIKSQELKDSDLVAIYPRDITDASFTGNTLLKTYNIKMVIMMYTSSCILSFRSNNHDLSAPNVSEIAKELNGGGHKNASGCTLPYDKFIELLKLAWYTIPGISDDLKTVKSE